MTPSKSPGLLCHGKCANPCSNIFLILLTFFARTSKYSPRVVQMQGQRKTKISQFTRYSGTANFCVAQFMFPSTITHSKWAWSSVVNILPANKTSGKRPLFLLLLSQTSADNEPFLSSPALMQGQAGKKRWKALPLSASIFFVTVPRKASVKHLECARVCVVLHSPGHQATQMCVSAHLTEAQYKVILTWKSCGEITGASRCRRPQ